MIPTFLVMNTLIAEPLSLQDSLELVSKQNPEVQIARLKADQANLERLKVLTNLVNVQASGSWLDFGEPNCIVGSEGKWWNRKDCGVRHSPSEYRKSIKNTWFTNRDN